MEFKNSDDVTETSDFIPQAREKFAEVEYEIERDVLLDMMFEAAKDDVEFIFGDSVVSLKEESNGVDVVFKGGQTRSFDLVFGCDGIHSTVRKCCFGEEASFRISLKRISPSRSWIRR